MEAAACLAESLETAARAPDATSGEARSDFTGALENDLDTPRAIDILSTVSGESLRRLGRVIGLQL